MYHRSEYKVQFIHRKDSHCTDIDEGADADMHTHSPQRQRKASAYTSVLLLKRPDAIPPRMHVDICNNILQVSPYILSSYVESRARANSLCKVPITAESPHYVIEGVSSFTQSVTRRRSSSDEQGMIKFKHPSGFSDEAIGEDLSSREFSRMGILIMGVL
ncbi:predicted protein [Sclerotinia sclerotiorum 1980 UF-70]|uniref:Uncharacterized protein n=1 Tax=Sclerotinia sclerotiorum (strain ATCC 18683 / 1980 / Ss-1) TaxID=665079 RepID=A7EPP9_SCLS1|nr:predicted protein [Sclerotinia sclerotiorum 1980 UF-70]EDO04815.1 predicted protein [Sclerotinia sclerotiorum 1980 UF-70]